MYYEDNNIVSIFYREILVEKLKYILIKIENLKIIQNKNHLHYWSGPKKLDKNKISAHYIVGLEGEIFQCIPENEIAYCFNQANSYSISIETCHPDKMGKFNVVTEKALQELVANLCKLHKLNPQTNIIRHYEVTGKQWQLLNGTWNNYWKILKNGV